MTPPLPEIDLAPYSVGNATRVTGLSEHTLRAWERRHGAVTPVRTQGGTRRYTQQQIDRLLLLKRAVDAGHRIGQLAELDDEAIAELLRPGEEPYAGPINEILAAIERFDATAVERQLELHFRALGPIEFAHRLVAPLLRELGRRWEHGLIGPATEHFASGITRSVLSVALREHGGSPNGPAIIFAAPSGERHEFGLLIGAILAAGEGFQVVYLGADLPVVEIARVAHEVSAAVVLVASTIGTEEAAMQLRDLRTSLDPPIELWLGGPAAGFDQTDEKVEKVIDFNHLQFLLRNHAESYV